MRTTHLIVGTLSLALFLAGLAARAEDPAQPAPRLGEHPAVLVARKGVQADPAANFYLHPARLNWSLDRTPYVDEHPAVLLAHQHPAIDPNGYILGHPAGGAPRTQAP